MTTFNSKGRHEKLAIVVRVFQNTYDFVISRCCSKEDGKEMYKVSKRTCRTIVLLKKPFVWWRSRFRRHRGLLKIPFCVPGQVGGEGGGGSALCQLMPKAIFSDQLKISQTEDTHMEFQINWKNVPFEVFRATIAGGAKECSYESDRLPHPLP